MIPVMEHCARTILFLTRQVLAFLKSSCDAHSIQSLFPYGQTLQKRLRERAKKSINLHFSHANARKESHKG